MFVFCLFDQSVQGVFFKEGDASNALLFIVKGSAHMTHKDARAAMAAYEDDRRVRSYSIAVVTHACTNNFLTTCNMQLC